MASVALDTAAFVALSDGVLSALVQFRGSVAQVAQSASPAAGDWIEVPDGQTMVFPAGVAVYARAANTAATALVRPYGGDGGVTILGSEQVGSTLRLSSVVLEGTTPIQYAVQWLRDGVAISGATSATYTITQSDAGTGISARVTMPGGAVLTSSNTVLVAGENETPASAYGATDWDIQPKPGVPGVAVVSIFARPEAASTDVTGPYISLDSGSGYGAAIDLTGLQVGGSVDVTVAAGVTSQAVIWDDSGVGTVNKSAPKSVTPWVASTAVAPAWVVQPSLFPASGPVGTVFEVIDGSVSGFPTPTLARTLMLGAVDVSASIVTGSDGKRRYTSTADGALTLQIAATNTSGTANSATATATVTATSAVTVDLGDGVTLSAPAAIVYVPDPIDGGYSVQHQAGIEIQHSQAGATTGDGVATVRDGIEWRPMAGTVGYPAVVLGADGRLVNGNNGTIYGDTKNVSPERTGADFTIPGAGALVIARSNNGTVPTTWKGQRATRAVQSYKVVTFQTSAPVAGQFRGGARGTVAPRANWTAAQVAARLDTVFPRALSGFDTIVGLRASDVAPLIAKLRQPIPSWVANWTTEPVYAQSGIGGYGQTRADAYGRAMIMLRASSTSYITDAQRLDLAMALAAHGKDWYCAILDGAYWQTNGGATIGLLYPILAAGLLFDDPYIMNTVLAPETAECEPGRVLGYLPITEQRCFGPVLASARTSGSPEGASLAWGLYVGSGSGGSSKKGDPDNHTLDADMIGVDEWGISPDRFGSTGNNYHWCAVYRIDNNESAIPAVAAIRPFLNGTHAGYDLTPLRTIGRYIDRVMWMQDAVEAAKTAGVPMADAMRFFPNNAVWKGPISKLGFYQMHNACVGAGGRHKGKPERPFSPTLSVSGASVTVTFHPIEAPHGLSVLSRKIYWSADNGATWATISGISAGAASHTFMAVASTNILVRVAIVTANGESPKSPNQPNKAAGTNAQASAVQGAITTGAVATVTSLATITYVGSSAQPSTIFYDSGKAFGRDAADIPVVGTATLADGTTPVANGTQIEVRLVLKDDPTVVVQNWQPVGTTTGGAWSGAFPGAMRSAHRLRAQARVVNSSATPHTKAQDILVGHIVCLIGQSEDQKMFDAWPGGTMTVPTFADDAARDSFFLIYTADPLETFAGNGMKVINESTPVGPAVAHMANVWTRNAPGEKVLFIDACQSGTTYIELVDDTEPKRDWNTSFADAIAIVRSWGADVGVLMSTWTAAPSALGDGYRLNHYPIFTGMYADGGGTAPVGAVTAGGGYNLDHMFWDLSGLDRPQAIFDHTVTKLAFHGPHRFEDCSHGVDVFATTTSGTPSASIDVFDNGGVDLDTVPRRFFTQGSGLASTETVVIQGSNDNSTWANVHTHAGSTSAHFNATPGGTLYQFYRATVTKTGGGAVSANVYITGYTPPPSGLIQQKQDTRGSIRNMVVDPVLAPDPLNPSKPWIMLPKGPEIITYMNGTPSTSVASPVWNADPTTWRDWTDYAHPSQHTDDGLAARARHTAIAAMYALGVGPAPAQNRHVPKFNRAYWDPDGSRVQLWYEDGAGATPRLSTTRRERGDPAIATSSPAAGTMPHRTEVAGFYRNGTPCTSVVIAPGVMTGGVEVVQVNAAGTPFTYADALTFLPGGASGIVQWPEDEFDQIWKNIPIAVNGIVGVEGIAMEPMPAPADIASTLPAPSAFVTTNAAGGPRFTDPAQIGTTSELTLRWKGKVTAEVGDKFFSITGSMLDIARYTSGASTITKFNVSMRDANNSSILASGATGVSLPLNQIADIVFTISLVTGNRVIDMYKDGVKVWTSALTGTAQNWATTRTLNIFAPAGVPTVETEIIEIWKDFTADGDTATLGTPYKRIAGGAGGTVVETPATPVWRV